MHHTIYYICCVIVMSLVPTSNAETLLQLASPDNKHRLLIVGESNSDPVRTFFSITDAQGKVIKEVGATEFPIIAAKWHKNGKALLVLEHISRQVVMRLITLTGSEWKMLEIAQFEDPPDNFNVVSVESQESAFLCYYFGGDRGGSFTVYRTEVSYQSGESKLLSAKKVPDEDFNFYKSSIGNELHRMHQAIEKGIAQYSAANEDEPNWSMPSVRGTH